MCLFCIQFLYFFLWICLCWDLLVVCWQISSISFCLQIKHNGKVLKSSKFPNLNYLIFHLILMDFLLQNFIFKSKLLFITGNELFPYRKRVKKDKIAKFCMHHIYFSSNFFFFELIMTRASVFQQISSISYDLQVKSAGRRACRIAVVVSCCIQHSPSLMISCLRYNLWFKM